MENALLTSLSSCADSACRLRCLRALLNAGLPTTVPTLLEYVETSTDPDVSEAAIKALRRINTQTDRQVTRFVTFYIVTFLPLNVVSRGSFLFIYQFNCLPNVFWLLCLVFVKVAVFELENVIRSCYDRHILHKVKLIALCSTAFSIVMFPNTYLITLRKFPNFLFVT